MPNGRGDGTILPEGKIDGEVLFPVLASAAGAVRDDVVLRSGPGIDCAVASTRGNPYVVLKSDPITFTEERIGWYAVHVNANDVAACGADPAWFLPTVLLPPGRRTADLERIMNEVHAAASSLGVAVVGGHTEVTSAVARIVIAGTMAGVVAQEGLVRGDGASAGDLLLMCGWGAVEGTAVAASLVGWRLRSVLTEEELARAAAFLDEPGISVVEPASICRRYATAMHDVTEGGVKAAAWEMAAAAGCGVSLDADAVPFKPLTLKIFEALGRNPLGALSSGALLCAVPGEHIESLREELGRTGIENAVIGRFLDAAEGCWIESGGRREPLRYEPRDALAGV